MDKQGIGRVAALAKLDVSGEGESFAQEINEALEIMRAFANGPPVPDAEPDLDLVNTYREDGPGPPLTRELALLNAPETEAGCVSVPKTAGVS